MDQKHGCIPAKEIKALSVPHWNYIQQKKVSQTPEQGFGDTSYLPSSKPLSFDYTVNLCLKHLLT